MNQTKLSTGLLKTKHHFDILDGLRGIAALAVVVFHFMEWIFTDPNTNFIGHGFLAVDFFFCLSGFVIGYAYDDRIGSIGVAEFFKYRLIRLHPLIILGSILGLLGLFVDPFAASLPYNAGEIALFFIASLLLIPLPTMEERFFNLFPLNAPSWSLFWEYVANIFYALVLHRAGRRLLMILTVVAAAGIFIVSYRAGNLLGGWSKDNFSDGGVRVAYSFLAGLLLYRCNWIIRNRLGFVVLAFLLSVVFVLPWSASDWLVEALIVVFYFPLLVSLGAGCTPPTRLKRLCQFSGNISYPLYMTHYAGIWVFGNYFTNSKPSTEQLVIVIIVGIILLIAIAYAAMVLFDSPVRRYLTRKREM